MTEENTEKKEVETKDEIVVETSENKEPELSPEEQAKVDAAYMKKQQEIVRVGEKIKESGAIQELEALVQDNKLEFKLGDDKYRVRKPKSIEREEANQKRLKKYLELLKDDEFMLEAQLREIYKKKGISIESIEDEIVATERKQEDYLLRLAKTTSLKDIEILKQQIIDVRESYAELVAKKNELLQYCIEKQLGDYVNSYFTYLLIEKQNGKEWERVFKSYDDFLNSDNEDLIIRAAYYLSVLIMQHEIYA